MPSASLGAPQFIPESLVVETFIVKDYQFLNRFGLGIAGGGMALFWYVVNVGDEYVGFLSAGANLGPISAGLSFGEGIHAGVGFLRRFYGVDVCGYAGLVGRRFGYTCVFSQLDRVLGGVELHLEEGYPLDYRFFARYSLTEDSDLFMAYSTLQEGFRVGFSYRFFTIGYGEHTLLGSSYYYRMVYRK